MVNSKTESFGFYIKMSNKKRGQITLFIIIGLVLLISISVIIYLLNVQSREDVERRAVIPSLPVSEADPVSDFINGILKKTATDGLKILGEQGGYIDASFFVNPMDVTESEGISFGAGSLKIPYWWYMKSPNSCQNNCEFDSKRPDLFSSRKVNIEDQLKMYIDEKVRENAGAFEEITQLGYKITEKARPNSKVNIREKDILVVLDWKLSVEKAESKYEIKDFYSLVDLNFKEIYDLATDLINMQIEYAFAENAVKSLIYSFARKDKNALPPVSDFEFSFGAGTYWIKSEVEKKVRQMLVSYLPMLQVTGTRNFKSITAPEGTKDMEYYEILYNRYFLIPIEKDYHNLEVNFYYLDWWKPYFDLNCDGELCIPDSTAGDIGFLFGIKKYNFAYDISSPLVVEINSPFAFNGEGYSFKFAIESNLRNNDVFTSEKNLPPSLDFGDTVMFCNQNQRTSGEISINIKEFKTDKNVEGVNLIYYCGDDACPIGTTEKETFVSQFPRCLNGILMMKKLYYMPLSIPLTADDDKKIIEAVFFPEKTLKVSGRKYDFIKRGSNWELDTTKFYDVDKTFENIVLTINKITDDLEESYAVIADLSQTDAEIKLYPGKYKASITGFNKKEVKIPKDFRCTPPERFLFIEIVPEYCYYVPNEDMFFNEQNPFPSTMTEVEFEILPEKLYNSREIIFPYFSIALDKVPEQYRKIEDLEMIGTMKDYSVSRKELLKPILK
jgi:hypothetical protein